MSLLACGFADLSHKFMSGYLSTASRDTPFMVLLFFSYEQFKAWKIRLTFADDPLKPMKPWSDAETDA